MRAETEITLLIDLEDKGEVSGAAVIEPQTPTGLGFEDPSLFADGEMSRGARMT